MKSWKSNQINNKLDAVEIWNLDENSQTYFRYTEWKYSNTLCDGSEPWKIILPVRMKKEKTIDPTLVFNGSWP